MSDKSSKKSSKKKAIPVGRSEDRLYDLSKTGDLIELLREESRDRITREVQRHICNIAAKYSLNEYTQLILFDDCDLISSYHSNQLYEAASSVDPPKAILLLVQSPGGNIEPGYLISKTCKQLSSTKFVAAVPRRAKSAATLICLGADEIHMGLMSELGPIDPQIGGYPALGLANALNKLAELASTFPGSSDMFAAYLTKNLNLKDLGYFERVSESAVQYGERLLEGKTFPAGATAEGLAEHFVNHYKDHGFVIDMDEASRLLGSDIVKTKTEEYQFANEVYSYLNMFKIFLEIIKSMEFYYVGFLSNGLTIRQIAGKS